MILISNTCVNGIIYKDYYKREYNNPFINCFICLKDFIELVSEYTRSMKDSWKFYVDWSLERKLINDDFKYTKMITGIYDDRIKINYLHYTNRKYELDFARDLILRRYKRFLNIRHKEKTIFVYVQHPLDSKEDIKKLINIKLGNNCKLLVYTFYRFSDNFGWNKQENKILDQNYQARDVNTKVIYVKPLKSPIDIYSSSNYLLNPLMDILRKDCFNLIVNNIKEYLKENKIEYNT